MGLLQVSRPEVMTAVTEGRQGGGPHETARSVTGKSTR